MNIVANRNPIKHRKSNNSWKLRNPDKVREMHLLKLYGITLKEYNSILLKQNGTCGVCDAADSGVSRKNSNKREPLFVDHCHKTGKVRGLLCRLHNTALGIMKDDVNMIQKLLEYLK